MLLCAMLCLLCGKKPKESAQEEILAQIGDRTVSVKEFQYRSEFTPRPQFPAKDKQETKKILLNNYMLEKMFAIEAGDNNRLIKSDVFQRYIRGIKEQAMRERLFYRKAFDAVKLDTSEIMKVYKLAGREYDVEFFTIHRDDLAEQIKSKIEANPDSADFIFNSLWDSDQRPKQTVKYKDPDHIDIHESLFTKPVEPGTIIGPLKLEQNNHIIMRVVDWRFIPAISGEDQQLRLNEVTEKMTLNRATRMWQQYQRDVMKGKQIEFEPATFEKLAEHFYKLRVAQNLEEKKELQQKFWDMERDDATLDDLDNKEAILDLPFFTEDGKTWTVRDFRDALLSHPLVYRKQEIARNEFRYQFQMAIADLVRDGYLDKDAYKEGLDKSPQVKRTTQMWKDALVAVNYRDEIIKTLGDKRRSLQDTTTSLNVYFDNYLLDLYHKYEKKIHIDEEKLNDISLTSVSMFAMQPGAPYPMVVPNFPIFTTQVELDTARNKE